MPTPQHCKLFIYLAIEYQQVDSSDTQGHDYASAVSQTSYQNLSEALPSLLHQLNSKNDE